MMFDIISHGTYFMIDMA